MTPTFTVVIGSKGNQTLTATLDSVQRQERVPGDRVIVCIDSFEWGVRPDVQEMVASYGEGFSCVDYNAGYHFMGVEQFNHAIRLAHEDPACTHIMSLGDDDIYVDGTYAALRPIIAEHPKRPVLMRFVSPCRSVLWDKPRMWPCLISGQCIVADKEFVGMAALDLACTVDVGWMVDIVDRSGVRPLYLDYIGVIARPDNNRRSLWRCEGCGRWGYVADAVDEVRDICCGRRINRVPTPIVMEEVEAVP